MDIYILDDSFRPIAVIDSYISAIWTTRYFAEGEFEIYLGATEEIVSLLHPGAYVVREDDIAGAAEFHNVMIVENIEIQTDVENGDNLIVTGYDLKSILRRRVVANQTNLSGTAEAGIRRLITENLISPTDSDRAVENFTLGTDGTITAANLTRQITGDNLAEIVSELCQAFGYGYDVYIDSGDFVFRLFEGTDRTASVFFSPEFDNLITSDYIANRDNLATAAIVAGEGEGTARRKVTVGTATGLSRREVWVDSRNTSSNGGTITDEEYTDMLTAEGEEVLKGMSVVATFSGEVVDGVFTFGVDYFLGDEVTVANAYGITGQTRIVEMIDTIDENGRTIIPTFAEMEG